MLPWVGDFGHARGFCARATSVAVHRRTYMKPASSDLDLYHELSYYTLAHPDPSFIHQLMVDAYAAQHADETTKPIAITFALLGLYLHVEKGFTGKQVQNAHMQLAKYRRQWFRPACPQNRGEIVIADVMAAAPGPQRDTKIHEWCASVWITWRANCETIVDLARRELGVT